jgi:L-seryl-tRNA(Ser) seleniumtransferase
MSDRRSIPAVDSLLQTHQAAALVAQFGRPLTLEAIRMTLDSLRNKLKDGEQLPDRNAILEQVKFLLESWLEPTLIPVINATGVILHTNLGRAPLSQAAMNAITHVAAGYSTLEFDLPRGVRGSRTVHTETLLTRLTGAEAALVVNNNAAAVLLTLSALAKGKRVIISRSQLVEIGGGFRIPDVMKQSGAKLVEIGTTNKIHIRDYELALQEPAALVLHAHQSNFKLVGFTSEPTLHELAAAAHQVNVPLFDDLGSGSLFDTAMYGLAHEPTIQESMAAGADIISFSGDKLLGGPQAGIIIGRKELVQKIARHPLARAVRADKLCLAALTATLLHYLKDEAEREIPIWQMISKTPEQIRSRAEYWLEEVGCGTIIEGKSTVGGGSLPEETMPTFLLAIQVPQPNKFLAKLRAMSPPVIARIADERVVFDPRTVMAEQDGALLAAVKNAMGKV